MHPEQIEGVVYKKLLENPNLIVAFNTDKQTPFDIVDEVMGELKQANATRVSFTADFEKSGS
jgi:biopolymer transport protein ExbD